MLLKPNFEVYDKNLNKLKTDLEFYKDAYRNAQLDIKLYARSERTTEFNASMISDNEFTFGDVFVNQKSGLLVGTCGAVLFKFLDDRLASWYAKKMGIQQKAICKIVFSTFICLFQVWLRKRNPNSKLANFLSFVRYSTEKDSVDLPVSEIQSPQATSTPDKSKSCPANKTCYTGTPVLTRITIYNEIPDTNIDMSQ